MIRVFAIAAAVALLPQPLFAANTEFLAPNAHLSVTNGFVEPNRPGGASALAGRPILEWLDSAPGQQSDFWSNYGSFHLFTSELIGGDGVCFDAPGAYSVAHTAARGTAVGFVLGCDWNDGRVEYYVDDTLVARIHCPTANWTDYVLLVDSLPYDTHTLRVNCVDPAPGDLTSGVFFYGAATLGSVPEPSALLALLCGFGWLGGMLRLKRR